MFEMLKPKGVGFERAKPLGPAGRYARIPSALTGPNGERVEFRIRIQLENDAVARINFWSLNLLCADPMSAPMRELFRRKAENGEVNFIVSDCDSGATAMLIAQLGLWRGALASLCADQFAAGKDGKPGQFEQALNDLRSARVRVDPSKDGCIWVFDSGAELIGLASKLVQQRPRKLNIRGALVVPDRDMVYGWKEIIEADEEITAVFEAVPTMLVPLDQIPTLKGGTGYAFGELLR